MRGLSYQKLDTVLIQNFSYDRNKNLTINNHDINGKIGPSRTLPLGVAGRW